MLCNFYLFFTFLLFDWRKTSFFLNLDFPKFFICSTVSFQHCTVHHIKVPERTTSLSGMQFSLSTRPPRTNAVEIAARRPVTALHAGLCAACATTNVSASHLSPSLPNKSPSASDCVWGRITSAACKQNRRAPGDERRTRFEMMESFFILYLLYTLC